MQRTGPRQNSCTPRAFAGVSAYNADSAIQVTQRGSLCPPRRVTPPGNTTIKGNDDLPKNTGFNARTFPKSIILARYVPTGEGGTTGTFPVTCNIYSPSNRLRLSVVATFEPDNTTTPDPAFVVVPSWSLRAMSRNPESGRETPLQLAYPPPTGLVTTMPLPDAYELDSAVKLLRLNATLQDTNFSTAYVAATARVNFIITCTWEPNMDMADAERDFLYGQCSISAQAPKLITNTAA